MAGTGEGFWLPRAGSTIAQEIDFSWNVVYWVAVFFFVLVVAAMTYFVVRYRRRSESEVPDAPDHNPRLEVIWTAIPIVVVIVLFGIGFKPFLSSAVAPKDSLEINVTAERWMWTFTYPNGTSSVNELFLPRGRPVKLVMSSKDVIHSFFVPEFRVKRDIVPNQYTTLWFEPTEAGEVTLTCTEYCGTGHSAMLARVIVLEEAKFQEWLDSGGGEGEMPLAELGQKLFTKMSCNTCHTLDGTANTGPTLKGVFGHEVSLADGSKVEVDENYLRESITNPAAKVVKGYQPVMPVFKGLLNQKQLDALIAFLKESGK